MTIENDFLTFAGSNVANVLDQADYAAALATANGFTTGTASSEAVNKTLRQSSIIAAMIAQVIVDQTGQPAIDDGTIATLETNFIAAIKAMVGSGRFIRVTPFYADGTFNPDPNANTTFVLSTADGGASGNCVPTGVGQIAASIGGSCGATALAQFGKLEGAIPVFVGQGGAVNGAIGGAGGNGAGASLGSGPVLLNLPGGTGGNGGVIQNAAIVLGQAGFAVQNPTVSGGVLLYKTGTAIAGNAIILGVGVNQQAASFGSSNAFGFPASGYGSGATGIISPQSSAALSGVRGRPGFMLILELT